MITPLPEKDSDGQKYVGYEEYCDQYLLLGAGWADITEKDKFLSLGLLAGEGFDPPSLAGKVEIILGTPLSPSASEILRSGDISSWMPTA